MIKLFEVINGVVVPTDHCITLKTLRVLKEEYPEHYMKMFQYIFYMTCPDPDLNPFFHTPAADKEFIILQEIEAEFSTETEALLEAVKFCTDMYSTETSRAYYGIAKMLDRIAEYMNNTEITDGKDGNIGQIRSMAKDFNGIRLSYKETYRDLKDEQSSKVRGNKNLAYDAND